MIHDEGTNISLTAFDLATLDGENWLNDNIINVYLSLISQSDSCKMVQAFSTFFYVQLNTQNKESAHQNARRFLPKDKNFMDFDLTLIPVHLCAHWILVIVQKVSANYYELQLYDPKYGDRFSNVLVEIKDFLLSEIETHGHCLDITFQLCVKKSIPRQKNCHDCGVYVCMIAKYRVHGLSFNFTDEDMQGIRCLMKKELHWKTTQTTMYQKDVTTLTQDASQNVSRLRGTRPRSARRAFKNPTQDICWLNACLQVVLRAMDIAPSIRVTSELGQELKRIQEAACPKGGFDARRIRAILACNQFDYLLSGQQCATDFLHALNVLDDNGEDGKWEDLSALFAFTTIKLCRCADKSCTATWEQDQQRKLYMDVSIPRSHWGLRLGSAVLRQCIEQAFCSPTYHSERQGCDIHPTAGVMEEEVLVELPEFLLVVLQRIMVQADEEEDGIVYITRSERCQLPQTIALPSRTGDGSSNTVYSLFAAVEWDGFVSPTTGTTNGHYTTFLKYDGTWYHANDKSVRKVKMSKLTEKAFICAFSRYFS